MLESIEQRTNDSPLFIERRDYAEALFGDLDQVWESDKNPQWLARELVRAGEELQGLYLACGTKDSLYAPNIRLRDELRRLGADVTWDESPHGHEWDFWDAQIKKVIDWLPLADAAAGINSGNVGV